MTTTENQIELDRIAKLGDLKYAYRPDIRDLPLGEKLEEKEICAGYLLFEPQQMLDENEGYFRKILNDFLNRYPFNPELFPAATEEV